MRYVRNGLCYEGLPQECRDDGHGDDAERDESQASVVIQRAAARARTPDDAHSGTSNNIAEPELKRGEEREHRAASLWRAAEDEERPRGEEKRVVDGYVGPAAVVGEHAEQVSCARHFIDLFSIDAPTAPGGCHRSWTEVGRFAVSQRADRL